MYYTTNEGLIQTNTKKAPYIPIAKAKGFTALFDKKGEINV